MDELEGYELINIQQKNFEQNNFKTKVSIIHKMAILKKSCTNYLGIYILNM